MPQREIKENIADLFVFLHRGIQFLREVIGYIRHARFLLNGSAQAAFILICFLVILLLCILTVPWCALLERTKC